MQNKIDDIPYQEIARYAWDDKYRFNNEDGVPATCKRIANSLFKRGTENNKSLFNSLSHQVFSPGGRIVAGAGTARDGVTLFNCFVLDTITDSMTSIMKNLSDATITMQHGGGIGHNFSTIRPNGSLVKSNGAKASGPVSFMKIWDSMCDTVKSAGPRRGAMMATLRVDHPDIIEFINCKKDTKTLTNFNLSVLITDKFMSALEKDEDFDLVFDGKVYQTVKAKWLWDQIMENNYDWAEPGVIFVDTVNKNNNLRSIEEIVACNPCFSGDTLVATADGRNVVPIKQLAEEGKDVNVYCYGQGETKIRLGRNPRKTGTKQLYKVTLSDGSSIRVTDNHKWILSNNEVKETNELVPGDSLLRFDKTTSSEFPYFDYNGKAQSYYKINGESEHRLIGREKLGRELLPYPEEIAHHVDENKFNNNWDNIDVMSQAQHNSLHFKSNFGVKNANSLKDLTVEKIINSMLNLISELDSMPTESEFLLKCSELGIIKPLSKNTRHSFAVTRLIGNFQLFKLYMSYTDTYRSTSEYQEAEEVTVIDELTGKEFTRKDPHQHGSTNPKVINRNFETYSNYLVFSEKSEFNWDFEGRGKGIRVSAMIRRMVAYAKSKGIEVTLDNWEDHKDFFINSLGGYIELEDVKNLYTSSYDLKLAGEIGNHSVVSVEKDTVEDVYNITVDQFHNLAIVSKVYISKSANPKEIDCYSGVFMRQCGEQPLPPNGACNLGSINLAKIVENPFTSDAKVNYDLLSEVVEIGIKSLDRVIDVSKFPLSAQESEAKSKRRIGLGITGLANMFIMLGMRYGSSESQAVFDSVMSKIKNTAYMTSANLAKELGPFPLWDKVKNSYTKSPFFLGLDAEVRNAIKKNGIRNSHLISIAPQGSTSLYLNNVSSGIEPVFAFEGKRNVTQEDGSFKVYEVYDYSMLAYNHLVENSDKLPDYFTKYSDLSVDDHLSIMAIAQKHVDSAISKTINVPTDISIEDFKEVYLKAYKLGCKGCTTYRPGGKREGILIDESVEKEESNEEVKVVEVDKKLPDRDFYLPGYTYKLKWPLSEHAIYLTINDRVREDGSRVPFEVFINSKNVDNREWADATTRMISAVFRRSDGDIQFVIDELKAVHSPTGIAWVKIGDKRTMMPSVMAYIGHIIEMHLNIINNLNNSPSLEVSDTVESVEEIAEGENLGSRCPKCGAMSLMKTEGCENCITCGYSKCG